MPNVIISNFCGRYPGKAAEFLFVDAAVDFDDFPLYLTGTFTLYKRKIATLL